MRLRNKKTGDVREFESLNLIVRAEEPEDGYESWDDYHSLAELNEEWEDYKPKEPLIKDEKVCKAVRAWADINNAYNVEYHAYCLDDESTFVFVNDYDREFSLDLSCKVDDLTSGKTYTIAELCGEEEE